MNAGTAAPGRASVGRIHFMKSRKIFDALPCQTEISFISVVSTAFSIVALVAASILVTVMPFAIAGTQIERSALLTVLQGRFPPATKGCGEPPTAILVPGGGVETYIVAVGERKPPPGPGERVTAAVELARTHPSAKLVFSGDGERDPTALIARQGIEPSRIIRETESHNTFENASSAARLLRPRRDQCFILVTSAAHMPRAVASYRAAGFRLSTQSVDYRTTGESGTGYMAWNEFVGLIMYRLLWMTHDIFPEPINSDN